MKQSKKTINSQHKIEYYDRASTGEKFERCSYCWIFIDRYPHYNNGYREASQRYPHWEWCPNNE